jgi:hypothetical protein
LDQCNILETLDENVTTLANARTVRRLKFEKKNNGTSEQQQQKINQSKQQASNSFLLHQLLPYVLLI